MPDTKGPSLTLEVGRHHAAVGRALESLRRQGFVRRFMGKDPTLWKSDEQHARVVASRMGWLESARLLLGRITQIQQFAEETRRSGIRAVILLGMGGSSLCPDVLRRTFGRARGHPSLQVLDTTDPETIHRVDRGLVPRATLFIVASKSGTTIESQMLYQHFAERAAPRQFIAITDPGTPLETLARSEGFRRVFLNPADIGGRYSALSYFGMVPAALLGLKVATLLERGEAALEPLRAGRDPGDSPAVVLGSALGALGLAGRDKVTFAASPAIAGFGWWAEQLIAESTGKEGRGLVPVEGEALGPPSRYGKDRVFVHLRLAGSRDTAIHRRLAALSEAGHPIVTVRLSDRYDLGGEFVRWEVATATAGSLLGIDPFDEPNVKESKDNTARVLESCRASGQLPFTPPDAEEAGLRIWLTRALATGPARRGRGWLAEAMDRLCRAARPGDYVAVMAYTRSDTPVRSALERLRLRLRDRTGLATTLGFGPRFLHSTGQLHKGGAGNGLFLQITSDKKVDVPIDGERFGFGVLQAAQAAGDFQSLSDRGFRAIRLHLGGGLTKDLRRVAAAI